MKFNDMPYARPDLDGTIALEKALAEKAGTVQSDAEMIAFFNEMDAAEAHWQTMASLAQMHYTMDTRNEYWADEQAFFDENNPAISVAQLGVYRALLQNPHAEVLDKTYGPVVVASLRNAVACADERTLALQQEENALTSRYQKLYGGATVEFDGKTLTIPQLGPYKESRDPAVRRAAYEAEAGYFDAHREEFDSIYDSLVKNRNEQARILGYHDFSELGYCRMNRIGYGPAEVQAFRDEVVKNVVPRCAEAVLLRRKRAGLPSNAKFWDNALAFSDGNPVPHGTKEELMASARKMYHELSPETGSFIDYMQDNDLFDVDSRPGKMAGGYAETIPDYKSVLIFANWNGTSGDVDVLTHEAGHAFEMTLAMNNPDVPNMLTVPGNESAEIHSMSMEFLTGPWHNLFFGPDTDKYELSHAEDSLLFLPYGCIVDEFQHIMYQQPDMSPEQRNQVWLSLERKYRPWVNFGDLPFYGRGAGWQRQLHIYLYPFYYIDYCLAQVIALQFFAAMLTDHADAWRRYMTLTRIAGRNHYVGLVEAAGLNVPFNPGSLADTAETVLQWLKEKQA